MTLYGLTVDQRVKIRYWRKLALGRSTIPVITRELVELLDLLDEKSACLAIACECLHELSSEGSSVNFKARTALNSVRDWKPEELPDA